MNQDLGIKLQAYLDGELSGRERGEFEGLLSRDPELQALRAEMISVSRMLRDADPVVSVPCSQDFYFSQIRRRIEAAEGALEVRPLEPEAVGLWVGWFQRALLPLGTIALAIFVLSHTLKTGVSPEIAAIYEETEALLEETGAMTFRSDAQGVTVVWLYDHELPPTASADEFE